MDPLDEYITDELLLNISGAGTLLTASQEDAFSTYQYMETLQEPQSRIVNSCSATGTLPSVDSHLGMHNFEVFISAEASGPNCLYSEKLNKIFVNIKNTVPVLFRTTAYSPGLYVRAVAIYLKCSDLHVPVTRCVTHKASDTDGNKDIDLVEHVVRCISPNARYYKAMDSGRFSVRVQLDAPQTGTEFMKMCYKFTCLTSCQTMGKMGIIFTLEDEKEEVLGRQFMNVRVCSCPRRDKEKEETKDTQTCGTQNSANGLKRPLTTLDNNGGAKKFLKSEPWEIPLVSMIPVKLCHLKELAKLASDLIYRDIGMKQRILSEQEKQILSKYMSIIEVKRL